MVCELLEPKKSQKTHYPQFCIRDVDRRFCGGGAWISRSDPCQAARLASSGCSLLKIVLEEGK